MENYLYDIVTCNLKKGIYISTFICVSVTLLFISTYLEFKHSTYLEFDNFNDLNVSLFEHQFVNMKNMNIVIVNEHEHHLTESKSCERMDLMVNYTKPSIVSSFGRGRTANQLTYFASGYAIWRQYGILNFLDKFQLDVLEKTFVLPESHQDSDIASYYLWREGKFSVEI